MVNIFDWNALDTKISSVAESHRLDRTRSLTAVAVSALMEIDLEESMDAITDGGGDRGVDALYIDDRDSKSDIHIFQTKCVTEFSKSKNNFPGSEIDKMISFIDDLTRGDASAFESANQFLFAKVRDALVTLKEPNASVTVHFVGNMAALTDKEGKRIREAFKRYRQIEFLMHDLESLSDFFIQKKTPHLVREITVIDRNFFERVDRNLRGVTCSVSALDIVDAIRSEKDPEQIDADIFDQNVRIYLKQTNRINRKIMESITSEDNHLFWYRNNGITMTCDKIEFGPSKRTPKIRMIGVQIVNGGQTSNCLFEVARKDREKLEDVVVLVRIIETSSEEVKASIAETTNSQTPVNIRDLRSNDRLQKQLEEEFENLGYFYERKKGQHADKPIEKRIDALTAGQAYLAYGIDQPETAKKDRGQVFGNLYDAVFSEDLTASRLLTAYRLSELLNEKKREVRRKIREDRKLANGEMSMIDGAFHALFAIRKICRRETIDEWDFDTASQKMDEAVKVIRQLYEDAQSKDPNFSSNRYFKNVVTKDEVIRAVG